MASVDNLIGRSIGMVRLEALIGRGSMGLVYRGWHEGRKEQVAVKILSPSSNDHEMRRFLRECRNASQVHDPHVVQVIESSHIGNRPYLVLELVIGEDLGKRIESGVPLAVAAFLRLARNITQGLDAIHRCGIVHRDIKPENILIDEHGNAKIADLGLSTSPGGTTETKLTRPGCVVGTPFYIAPEYISTPGTVSPAGDIYALGATLYHAATAQPPFDAPSVYRLMEAHLHQAATPLHERRADLPLTVCQATDACLGKLPAQRPTTAQLLAILSKGPIGS